MAMDRSKKMCPYQIYIDRQIVTVICFILFYFETLAYQWLQHDYRFDCTVGITVDNKPVSIGIFITTRTVISSANPLNQYLWSSTRIKIHTISGSYTNSVQRNVEDVFGNQSLRKQAWITIGYNDTSHTTIHDIVLINMIKSHYLPFYSTSVRKPFPITLPYKRYRFNGRGWFFAGFGYIDEDHIKDNNVLEVTYFDAELVDCDEWIPREWGRFICLLDEENLAGLASGSPLFHKNNLNTVYGLGSFELKKGNDKILVFTDLRPYVYKLYGFPL